MIRAACLTVALLAGACYATRPPTTSLQVVSAAPEGAVPVGMKSPVWAEDDPECRTPPERIRQQAMKWGADYLVVDARPTTVEMGEHKGERKGVCRAQGYAAR